MFYLKFSKPIKQGEHWLPVEAIGPFDSIEASRDWLVHHRETLVRINGTGWSVTVETMGAP